MDSYKHPDSLGILADMKYEWVTTFNYLPPRTGNPPLVGGYLMIDSDDGNMGDYDSWFPLVKVVCASYSQWHPSNLAKVVCAINTGVSAWATNKMQESHFKQLIRYGWEIISHGRYHTTLGRMPLRTAATAGDTVIHARDIHYAYWAKYFGEVPNPYDHIITDGVNEELIKITGSNPSGQTVTIENPLQHSYAIENTYISLTPESMVEELQGCLDDLREMGIDADGHVMAYHYGLAFYYNPVAMSVIEGIFANNRGRISTTPNDLDIVAIHELALNGGPGFHTMAEAEIDTYLDAVSAGNKVGILYGHGEGSAVALSRLEYILRGAIDRGVKIINRRELLSMLTE